MSQRSKPAPRPAVLGHGHVAPIFGHGRGAADAASSSVADESSSLFLRAASALGVAGSGTVWTRTPCVLEPAKDEVALSIAVWSAGCEHGHLL